MRGERVKKNNYVYKFFDEKDEVIYVGLTNNINNRISSHKSGSDFWGLINRIEYAKCKNSTDMRITELILINYYNPKYNKRDKIGETEFTPPQMEWKKIEGKLAVKNSEYTIERFDQIVIEIPHYVIKRLKNLTSMYSTLVQQDYLSINFGETIETEIDFGEYGIERVEENKRLTVLYNSLGYFEIRTLAYFQRYRFENEEEFNIALNAALNDIDMMENDTRRLLEVHGI